MSKISIIVPVYKAEKHIKRCIESILNQTYNDFELILVDDGSPDNSSVICDEYEMEYLKIKVFHKQNGGVSSARNAGIDIATGEYIMFVDSDDYIDKDMLETMFNYRYKADLVISGLCMETYHNGIMVSNYLYKMKYKEYTVRTLFEALEKEYPLICISGPYCKLFTSSIIKEYKIRFNEEMSLGEDTYFNLGYLEHCSSIVSIDNEFYHYVRENGESLFTKYNKDSLTVHEKVLDKMRLLILKNKCDDNCKLNFEQMYYNMLVGCVIKDFQNQDLNNKEFRTQTVNKVINNPYIAINVNKFKLNKFKEKLLQKLVSFGNSKLIYYIFKVYYKKS